MANRRNSWGYTKPPVGAVLNSGHPLAKGLVGNWLFNEPGGFISHNLASPSGYLTLTGGAFSGIGNFNGPALNLVSASSEYAEYAGTVASATPLSIAAWFNTTAAADIVSITNSGQTNYFRLLVKLDKGVNHLQTAYTDGVTSNGNNGLLSPTYTLGTWALGVAVFTDAQHSTVYLLPNQIQVSSSGVAAIPTGLAFTEIGRFGTSGGNYLNGAIDSVCIWNRALTPDEVSWLYREPFAMLAPPGPRRAYSLPASSGGRLFRYSNLDGLGGGGPFFSNPIGG